MPPAAGALPLDPARTLPALDPARGISFANSGKIEIAKKGSIFDSKAFFAKGRAWPPILLLKASRGAKLANFGYLLRLRTTSPWTRQGGGLLLQTAEK